jgi:hypothetical protein
MAKLFPDKPTREKNVADTLASLRIENLSPSDSLKLGLQDYIEEKNYRGFTYGSEGEICRGTTRTVVVV